MSAICKTIPIHGDCLGNLMRYGANPEKTDLLSNGLENLLSYAENADKTTIYLKPGEKSVLVDGVLCNPVTAELDFKIFRDRYRMNKGTEIMPEFDMRGPHSGKEKHVKKMPLTAIHLIQSFSDPEFDPRHQLYQSRQRGPEDCSAVPTSSKARRSADARDGRAAPFVPKNIPKNTTDFIDTFRYAWNGRRRGNLEMLLKTGYPDPCQRILGQVR